MCGSASMCDGPHAGDPRRARGDYTFFLKIFNFLKKSEIFLENPKQIRILRNYFGKSEKVSDFSKLFRNF